MSKFSMGNNRSAKLTPEQVLWGRAQYDLHVSSRGSQGLNMREIAEIQQVSRETVARYLRGETWKQYGGPGMHEGATEPSSGAEMHNAALEAQAMSGPPNAAVEAAAMASLARLQLKIANDQPKAEEDKGDDED